MKQRDVSWMRSATAAPPWKVGEVSPSLITIELSTSYLVWREPQKPSRLTPALNSRHERVQLIAHKHFNADLPHKQGLHEREIWADVMRYDSEEVARGRERRLTG